MAEFSLKAETPLAGAALTFNGIAIEEVTGRAIVSVAAPEGGETQLCAAMPTGYGVNLPTVGASASTDDVVVLGLARDQFWLMFEETEDAPELVVRNAVGDCGYLVDQSDAWALVRLSGPRCRDALERICPLDLAPETFKTGAVARTSMEHLSVIIYRENDDSFLMLSPRSSAASFLHALEVSARNVS